jgi:transcriptional regulator with XRE-family HTH domain
MNGIDARLRMARARTKQTQKEIATVSGVSLATIQRAEDGQYVPRTTTLRKLAGVYGVRLEWLITGDGPMLRQDSDQ